MTRLVRLLCVVMLAAAPLAPPAHAAPPAVSDPPLATAIALAREGDFQGALPKLDEALRRLETSEAPPPELAQGYLYLGISYLELDQRMPALERFRAAVLRDPTLRLDPAEFSPQVIRFFEAAREEVAAMRQRPPSPAASPSPAPARKKKKKNKTVLLVVGGAAAVAGIVALSRDGASAPPTTMPPRASSETSADAGAWTTFLEVPGGRGEIRIDGAVQADIGGSHPRSGRVRAGRHRVIATLTAAARPGVWRFEIQGLAPGSLRPEAGAVEGLSPGAIAFRLQGRAGERIAFTFETTR